MEVGQATRLIVRASRHNQVKASGLGDGNAIVLVDQQLFVKRNCGLDSLVFIGLAGAVFDGAFAVEGPDLPERAGGHEVDLELIRIASDEFKRFWGWCGARGVWRKELIYRRHSCSYWSSVRLRTRRNQWIPMP
jgi:hypothetical protein